MDKEQIFESGLMPLEQAAAALGIEPKRLLGYCLSPKPWAPISDGRMVYGWSLRHIPTSAANVVQK